MAWSLLFVVLVGRNAVSTPKCLVFGAGGGFCLEARSCNVEARLEHRATCFRRDDYIE